MLRITFLLLLAALTTCKAPTFPDEKRWQLRALEGEALPATVETTLQLDAGAKRFSGAAPCNSYSGSFTLAGDTLTFGNIMSTKRFCEQMPWESRYFAALPRVNAYRLTDKRLELLDAERKVVAVFE